MIRRAALFFLAGAVLLSLSAVLALPAHVARAETDQAASESNKTTEKLASNKTYNLRQADNPSQSVQVQLQLEVGGQLTLTNDGQLETLPMSVVADIAYEERPLHDTRPRGTVRHYERADAVIKVDKGGVDVELDDSRRLIVSQRVDTQGKAGSRLVMFSPNGPLTRDMLDLVDIVGSSTVLADLLPDKPVAVGQSWQHTEEAIAALVRLEAISMCQVESVIGEVKDGRAKIAMAGTVLGAAEGTASEIEVKANYEFDLNERRITQFNLAVKEKRPVGHVSPGADVTARLDMRITPLPEPRHLTDELLAKVPTQLTPEAERLEQKVADGKFRLLHDRRWYATVEQPNLLVMRLVDRGELVAQCNVSALSRVSPEHHLTLEEFQKDIRFALGERFGEFVSAGQRENASGHRVFRVVVRGQVEELPIEWRYYLIAHRDGRRASFVFTVEGPLAERLGDADQQLVHSIAFAHKENPPEGEAGASLSPAAKKSASTTNGRSIRLRR